MAAKISVECPACAAKLNLADSSKLGKKIKCPKCSEVFVAEADILDDDDDLDEEPEQPSSRKRGGTSSIGKDSARGSKKGAKKGKAAAEGSNLPLIIGGVVALLALVGGGLYFSGVFNGAPAPQAAPTMPIAAAPTMPMAAAPTVPTVGAPVTAQVAPPSSPSSTAPVSPTIAPVAQAPGRTRPPAPVQAPPISPRRNAEAEKVLGLGWMPADTDLLVHVKVAAIADSPLVASIMKGPLGTSIPLETSNAIKLAPADIESISIGVGDSSGAFMRMKVANDRDPSNTPVMVQSSPFQTPPVPKALLDQLHIVIVLKSRKPMDLKTEAASIPNSKLMEKDGKAYFEVGSEASAPAVFGAWMPDPNTFIYATLKDLFATMERGETNTPRNEFGYVDHKPQIVCALAAPQSTSALIKLADDNGTEFPAPVTALVRANSDYGFHIGSIGLSITGGFDLQYSAVCGTDDGANKLKAVTENQINDLKTLYNSAKGTLPPLIAELGDLVVSSLKIEEANQTLKVSASLPDSAKDKIEQLPFILMSMAMMPGLGGGPPGMKGANPFGGSAGAFPGAPGQSFAMPAEYVKLPGETDSVEASGSEGLPDGLTLTARTAWSAPAPASAGGAVTTATNTTTFDVVIDVTGDNLDTIYGATGITSKTAKLDGGSSLKKTKLTLPGSVDAQKTFIPFDVDNMLPTEQPAETLRLRLTLDMPSNPGDKIAVLEGSFKFLTAETSEDLTVENVPQTAKQPLKGAEFKAGGVKLIRGPKDASPETLKLECAKDHFLGRVRGTPGDIVSQTEVEKGATIQRIYAKQPDGKFPEDFQIEFKLYGKIKEHTVTFRFENIPLPAADSKPTEQPAPAQ